ncbi:hypothetical protein [Rhizobium binae]|uniref:hypothetical protein n=1 Tax=Rhizobium binae TaxID=1138190 RepID=UPI001C84085B|nr:hypothetical protein [Rhizobium binae]MBX4929387.1 hypothetical protein [Rhizobium binae]MBX4940290.1 hypothetical protein [Rhizobium binae]MBX4946809.1 hypothetical protein [Rhizobium binae]MBX4965012.1 hypothetical protein [Rhizobium binae]MBX4968508.1 hypothetical protein [Rhizobium binae]
MVTPPVIQQTGDRFATNSFADIISAETFADAGYSARSGLLQFAIRLFRIAGRGHPKLDVEATPEYMKRDLGFMDGRNPFREDRLPL